MTSAGPEWRLSYRPELDGIRALAVGAVVLSHAAESPRLSGGGFGVDVFFVLSGFLITCLLVEEVSATGGLRLGRFYAKRALRLYPALLVMVAYVALSLSRMPPTTGRGFAPATLYYANWYRAFVGDIGALNHTWSLAIEEQFYLLWPAMLVPLVRRDRSVRIAAGATLALAAAVTVLREVCSVLELTSEEHLYNGFQFRADGILVGCALALAFHGGFVPSWLSRTRTLLLALVALGAVLTASLARQSVPQPRTVIAAAVASLIAGAFAGSGVTRWLGHPLLRYVGTRSYAIYLWHYPLSRALLDGHRTIPRIVVMLALTAVAAEASFRLVERPARRLRHRLDQPTAGRST